MKKFILYIGITVLAMAYSVQAMTPRTTRAQKIIAARDFSILEQAILADNLTNADFTAIIEKMYECNFILNRPANRDMIRELELVRKQRGIAEPKRLFVFNPPRGIQKGIFGF